MNRNISFTMPIKLCNAVTVQEPVIEIQVKIQSMRIAVVYSASGFCALICACVPTRLLDVAAAPSYVWPQMLPMSSPDLASKLIMLFAKISPVAHSI